MISNVVVLTRSGPPAGAFKLVLGISDSGLSIILGGVYILIPTLLVARSLAHPTFWMIASPILGSIAPLSILLFITTVDFLVNQRTGEDAFGFYAMWGMGFGAYVASLIIGCVVSFIRKPANLIGRFFVGLTSVSLVLPALLVFEQYT